VQDKLAIARDNLLNDEDKQLIEQDNQLIFEDEHLIVEDKHVIFEDKQPIVEDKFLNCMNLGLICAETPKICPKSRDPLPAPGLGGGARLLTSRLARTLAPPTAGSGLPALPQRADSRRSFTRMPLACL
jgi:hypothetical protein